MEGLIIKALSGFYYVETEEGIIECKARGRFRNSGTSPLVGDRVEVILEGNKGVVDNISQRRNFLNRPPVANIDKMFIVIAPSPKPDFALVDKIIIYCHLHDIQPIIVVNKNDLDNNKLAQEVEEYYRGAYQVISISAKTARLSELESEIDGICVLAGQSAVGKSSLINALFKKEDIASVGELSKKIERGKQTTRMVNLYKVKEGAYIADTAGFSLLDFTIVVKMDAKDLSLYYPDFLQGRANCKFRSCTHEGGDCGVAKLVYDGVINKKRYENYLKILKEVKCGQRH